MRFSSILIVTLTLMIHGCGRDYPTVEYKPAKPAGETLQVKVPPVTIPATSPVMISPVSPKVGQPIELVVDLKSPRPGMLAAQFSTASGGQTMIENSAVTHVNDNRAPVTLTLGAPNRPSEFNVELKWIEKISESELSETVIATGKMTAVR